MLLTIKNWFYFYAGIVFLGLAKTKSIIHGYSSPKPFSIDETIRCVEYDIGVVEKWLSHLHKYTLDSNKDVLKGKRVLELGPGSDLGVGLYLLSKGVDEYNAVDVNDLVKTVPDVFYEELFTYMKEKSEKVDEPLLRKELDKTKDGRNDKLNYVCRDDFDIPSALGDRKVDLIFSQAAFEHFDDIEKTVKLLSNVVVRGAIAIILIDLKTHSRWIRDKDPINIYRYPEWIYRLFNFRGIPNRVRPYQYKDAFEMHGFGNVKIVPGRLLSDDNFNFVKKHLSNKFKSENNQMDYLSMWLYATKL